MKNFILYTTVASVFCGMSAAFAAPQPTVNKTTQLGLLTCEVEGGIGYLIGSSKAVNCDFRHRDGSIEKYSGRLGKFGLDIGITGKSYLKWMVVTSAGQRVGDGALAGQYGGVSVGGALGIGLGVHALIGGSRKQIGLQPFSTSGTVGVNVAAGATSLSLRVAQ
ncbi:DUF992 domain-containing protein [Brucella sp. HL-2]|nr:DUF992 domain-containing protein [Brucella sp. HL-2]MCV9910471.1 DUF992 domain-containing protein [Brucella sp. HL-2]